MICRKQGKRAPAAVHVRSGSLASKVTPEARSERHVLNIDLHKAWNTMKFSDQRMDGSEFRNCSLANAVFDDVNLSGARLTNVNLSGLVIENANIKGLKIFGHDVESWIREQLRKDGGHLD